MDGRRWGVLLVLALGACGRHGAGVHSAPVLASQQPLAFSAGMPGGAAARARALEPPPAGATLAREHLAIVELPESALPGVLHRLVDACTVDLAHHCQVLSYDLAMGTAPSAQLRARVEPAGVGPLIDLAAAAGTLVRRSTSAEDLSGPIADTATRLAMLMSYRKQLAELQQRSSKDVESAIKIAEQLARTQAELEAASSEAANLKTRVTTEVLTLTLQAPGQVQGLHPVRNALGEFLEDLGNGIAQVITAVAYLLPWLALLVPALLGVRYLWRRRRR